MVYIVQVYIVRQLVNYVNLAHLDFVVAQSVNVIEFSIITLYLRQVENTHRDSQTILYDHSNVT